MFNWAQTSYAGRYLAGWNGFAPFPSALAQQMLGDFGYNVRRLGPSSFARMPE